MPHSEKASMNHKSQAVFKENVYLFPCWTPPISLASAIAVNMSKTSPNEMWHLEAMRCAWVHFLLNHRLSSGWGSWPKGRDWCRSNRGPTAAAAAQLPPVHSSPQQGSSSSPTATGCRVYFYLHVEYMHTFSLLTVASQDILLERTAHRYNSNMTHKILVLVTKPRSS